MPTGTETLRVEVGIATEQGTQGRSEDFAGCLLPKDGGSALLSAIADGVGGARGGRVAAGTAVRLFIDAQDELGPLRWVKANAVSALSSINR